MKKFSLLSLAAITFVATFFTGCFGDFALTKKVYDFNKGLGNKWIQTIVLWAMVIIPVYEFCIFIDYIILNLVQFWTGSNPIAMNEGEMEQQIVEKNGVKYQMTATKNNMNIVQLSGAEAGKTVNLVYTPETKTWSYVTDEVNIAMFQNIEDANGNVVDVEYFKAPTANFASVK